MIRVLFGVKEASVLRSRLIVWIVLGLRFDALESQKPKLNMLFYLPANTAHAIANRTAPVIVVATDTLSKRDVLKEFEVHWSIKDNGCTTTSTMKQFYEVWVKPNDTTHVVFGGYCEDVCQLLTVLSSAMELPFLAIGCRTSRKRNHLLYPSLLSVEPSFFFTIPGIIKLMDYFKWERIGILATPDTPMVQLSTEIKEAVDARNWTATLVLTAIQLEHDGVLSEDANREVQLILEEMKKIAKIIFLAMANDAAAHFLLMAQKLGMYNGEYAFIGYDLTSVAAKDIGASEEEWKTVSVGLISFVADKRYADFESHRFVELINANGKSADKFDPIQIQELDPKDRYSMKFAGQLYEAIFLYSYLLNNSIVESRKAGDSNSMGDLLNGTKLLAFPNNVPAEGKLFEFDPVGRCISDWIITNSGQSGNDTQIGSVKLQGKSVSIEATSMVWPGNYKKTPSSEPRCGWNGEKCERNQGLDPWVLIYCCSALGINLVLGVFLAIICARRMKAASDRNLLAEWQVKWSQVIVLGDNMVGRLSYQDRNRNSNSFTIGNQAQSLDGRTSERKSTNNRLYTLAGNYKGKTVAIKRTNRETVDIFQPAIYNELKQLLNLSHHNVNSFMGVCAEAPNVCVLMLYADRGSLQDVLAETKYDINWEFRVCLATDVAKGMEYLHESPVGPHGHLTSSNCVVDSKWECKITDFGLKQFKRSSDQEISLYRRNADLFWTAPEILKKPETDQMRVYGTKEGDVYSFGIIVYELITKEMPYNALLEAISPEDVVVQLKTNDQFRPRLPEPGGPLSDSWNNLATVCWHKNPEVRPTFRSIPGKLKAMNGGTVPNLMDRMQHMMEDALQRKAMDIAVEKRRTEVVVYNLLPQMIAEKIIDGKAIRSERLKAVTLCFCETRDIYESSKSLSPIQMTELLKSLFLIYDVIIKRHHATVVSCRGAKDSMILGSGMPKFTDRHAEDICNLSLDLIREALTFKTPLAPQLTLNLKISVHTGPVITAVIWQVLPRYSVTGEAVQTVTEMQKTSKAMRVQISEATHGRIKKTRKYTVEQSGRVSVKNEKPIKTYWLTGKTEHRGSISSSTSGSVKKRSSSLRSKMKRLTAAKPLSESGS